MLPKHYDIMPIILDVLLKEEQGNMAKFQSYVIDKFSISKEESALLIKSKTQTMLYNRVCWACSYLYQAGLISRVSQGVYKLTEEGSKVAKSGDIVNIEYLKQYPSFINFLRGNKDNSTNITKNDVDSFEDNTPEESVNNLVERMDKELADELLDTILNQTPTFFEHLVVDLLRNMGYAYDDNSLVVTKISGDGGIDGIVSTDKLGLDKICIQAKRYDKNNLVTRKELRDFLGALDDFGSDKGVFITTSDFNKDASSFYEKSRSGAKIVMINGEKLCRYMIDYNLGVVEERTIVLKKLDKNYFL